MYTVKIKINEKCAMSLDFPPLVRSGVFCPQMSPGPLPRSVFPPFSKVGNSELHSTSLVYFSFYGSCSGFSLEAT